MTDDTKRHYWGIKERPIYKKDAQIVFTGTHEQCWKELVRRYPTWTLADLVARDIRISRIK